MVVGDRRVLGNMEGEGVLTQYPLIGSTLITDMSSGWMADINRVV